MSDFTMTVREARDLLLTNPVVTIGPRRRCTVCGALISLRGRGVRTHRRWHQALVVALGGAP